MRPIATRESAPAGREPYATTISIQFTNGNGTNGFSDRLQSFDASALGFEALTSRGARPGRNAAAPSALRREKAQAPCAVAIKSAIFAASFRPGFDSTPLDTSTP